MAIQDSTTFPSLVVRTPNNEVHAALLRGVSQADYNAGFVAGAASVALASLSNPAPASGGNLAPTRAAARYTPVSFDITNLLTSRFSLWIKFRNDDRVFVVYDSVTGLSPWFEGSIVGSRLTVVQDGGWQDDISGLGVSGNAAAFSWTLPAPTA